MTRTESGPTNEGIMTPEDRQRILDEEMQRLKTGFPPKHDIGFDLRLPFQGMLQQMRELKDAGLILLVGAIGFEPTTACPQGIRVSCFRVLLRDTECS